jgi:transcriptional regulator with XRE-family HTH domain
MGATRLRAWRIQRGWSLQQFGDLTGLSPGMVSRVERGLRNPSPAIKVRISQALGIRVRDLFDPPARNVRARE